MASELRGKILNADDIAEELVSVPEWDTKILVKGMTGTTRGRFLKGFGDTVDIEKFYPDLVIATAYDPETGEPIFEAADRDALNAKSGAAIDKVSTVAMRLSGLGTDAVDKAKADLETAPSDASTST